MGERHETMRSIEQKHLGRCFDQVWGSGRRVLIELMELRGTNIRAVVVKQFERSVPPSSSSKPWPELSGAWVYVPIEDGDNTWAGLDDKLAEFRKRHEVT